MREPLKSMLENLPNGLNFDKENNDLYAFCNDCNFKISYEIRQRNIKEGPYYCRSCAQKHKTFSEQALINISQGTKKRTASGNCTICGKFCENRNASGMCEECSKAHFNKIIAKSKSMGKCSICGVINEIRDQNGRGISNCNCSKEWYQKHNSSEEMIKVSCSNLNLKLNFINRNNVLYYYDREIQDYIPWKEFKRKFEDRYFGDTVELDEISWKYGGEFLPTFIEKYSSQNCGHAAFDQLLLDKNINWFVYIKFFKRTEISNSHPLVVGKSGSKLVNSTGCDLSFSKDVIHGPSRLFLNQTGYDYVYHHVWVIPCKTEAEAYEIESKIAREYNLFES